MDKRRHYTIPVRSIEKSDCIALITAALDEDAPSGDPTSESIFPVNEQARALIIPRESGVFCGGQLVHFLLEAYAHRSGRSVSLADVAADGTRFAPGDVLLKLTGAARDILRLERPILNFLQYLCGIATTVATAVASAPANVSVLDTRKTLPGYRRLAKYAVFCGGGTNHRIHLSDMAMIKDNHIAQAGSIARAAASIKSAHPELPLEIEVDSVDQLREALAAHPRAVLLDNMDVNAVRQACKIAQELPEVERPFLEVSGGWKPERLRELADVGPVGVSMGYLTHTTRFLDLSLELQAAGGGNA